jgi:hypothetical protein
MNELAAAGIVFTERGVEFRKWPPRPYVPTGIKHKRKKMTGDQSRTLGVGDRVCWGATTTDLGTVVGTSWSEITISWDDGEASSVSHNDMARVERVPMKIM